MEIDLKELIEESKNIHNVTSVKTDYDTFKKNEVFIEKFFGNSAKGFFIEKSAYVIFNEQPEILVIIKKDKFNKSDFIFRNIDMKMEGKSGRKINGFFQNLKMDISNYKIGLAIILLIYIVIFCMSGSVTPIEVLNSNCIEIVSIFIATLFVFATMFYEEKEMVDSIRTGKIQEVFLIDKYIFILAMFSLIFTIISNGILNYELPNDNAIYIKNVIKQNIYFVYWFLKYGIAQILTGISIVFNYICFRSIIDYYLEKIKSKAINAKIRSIKEEITHI